MDQPAQAGEVNNSTPTPVISPTPFAPKLLIAIVIILILIAGGIGIYLLMMRKTQPVIPPPVASIPQSTPTPPTSPSANWKTYTNQQLSLSFQYPSEWSVKEASLSANPEEMSHLLLDFSPAGGENRMLFGRLDFFDNPDNLSLMALEAKRAEIDISGMAPAIYSPTDQSVTIGKNIQGFIRKDAVCEPVICDIYTWQYGNKVFQLMHFKDKVPGQSELFNQILATFRFTDGSQSDSTFDWKTYTDDTYKFMFQYPNIYIPFGKPTPFPDSLLGKLAALASFKNLDNNARIDVYLDPHAFSLDYLKMYAPTGGEDFTPAPQSVGSYTFYYYGPGGGGVAYPDQYFFNLNGKIIYILFIGPYTNDKTPPQEAKDLENKILTTFRFD